MANALITGSIDRFCSAIDAWSAQACIAWCDSGRSRRPTIFSSTNSSGISTPMAIAIAGATRSIITSAPTKVNSNGTSGTRVPVTKFASR